MSIWAQKLMDMVCHPSRLGCAFRKDGLALAFPPTLLFPWPLHTQNFQITPFCLSLSTELQTPRCDRCWKSLPKHPLWTSYFSLPQISWWDINQPAFLPLSSFVKQPFLRVRSREGCMQRKDPRSGRGGGTPNFPNAEFAPEAGYTWETSNGSLLGVNPNSYTLCKSLASQSERLITCLLPLWRLSLPTCQWPQPIESLLSAVWFSNLHK